MSTNDCATLSWNVRGLNSTARQQVVRNLVMDINCSCVCLQETKLEFFDQAIVNRVLGPSFADNFCFPPATGTRGGILLAVSDSKYSIESVQTGVYSITANLKEKEDGSAWSITGVYGPQPYNEKRDFLEELKQTKNTVNQKWMILGDFNLIVQDSNKNNNNLNRGMMQSFRAALNTLEVIEIKLNGSRYTWSSETEIPTLTKIDRVFCSHEWEERFPNCLLSVISTMVSDHCPLLLTANPSRPKCNLLRFEKYWIRLPGFLETVQSAWSKPVHSPDALKRIHIKLARTAKALRNWSRCRVRSLKLRMEIASKLIFRLDLAQEEWNLSAQEILFRRSLKQKLLGLAALDRVRLRQRSRQVWIKAGDANTRFFQIKASARRRKNFIQHLLTDSGMVHSHEEKGQELFNVYKQHSAVINPSLQEHNLDLADLEAPFSVEEIKSAIFQSRSDNSPGPDGFTGAFFKKMLGHHS